MYRYSFHDVPAWSNRRRIVGTERTGLVVGTPLGPYRSQNVPVPSGRGMHEGTSRIGSGGLLRHSVTRFPRQPHPGPLGAYGAGSGLSPVNPSRSVATRSR